MDLNHILDFLTGPYFYPSFFILMILCGLGFPLNSDLVLLFVGSLSSTKNLTLEVLILLAVIGLGLGDSLTFLIGKRIGFKLLKVRPLSIIFKKERIWSARRFIKKKGPKVIFLVRFIPGTRTATILTSGIFKIKFSSFLLYNLLGISILSTSLLLSGSFFISGINQAKENLPILLAVMFLGSLVILFLKRLIKVTFNSRNFF